ncbi:MAG: glutathione S-transferase C-terminal domain-containing protein [Opitutales bacterium]|nr:glutathione S-transferase C-terminal domain-containing protein [Opitutales bacterium]
MVASGQFPDEQSEDGDFKRQEDAFRNWVSADEGSGEHPVEPGRYQLYVSLACPWAHRALIVRNLCGLELAIPVEVVDPERDERGWALRKGEGHGPDRLNGFKFLSEAYKASDPDFSGRVTVPVLWDSQRRCIVNNSEDDLCRMFHSEFGRLRTSETELFPADIEKEHSALADFIYENINNGVYEAGFATKQSVYEQAVGKLFEALDTIETRLDKSGPYLFGDRIVEADWRLFCTLIRFDAVYHGHFKCNLRRIVDYPKLQAHTEALYKVPGIADTVNFDHIKRHYYRTHDEINPTRIVPLGPAQHWQV